MSQFIYFNYYFNTKKKKKNQQETVISNLEAVTHKSFLSFKENNEYFLTKHHAKLYKEYSAKLYVTLSGEF